MLKLKKNGKFCIFLEILSFFGNFSILSKKQQLKVGLTWLG